MTILKKRNPDHIISKMLNGIVFVCETVIFKNTNTCILILLIITHDFIVIVGMVCVGPVSSYCTAHLLFIHLSPWKVQSFTSSHIRRSNVQWTGHYSDSGKKIIMFRLFGYLEFFIILLQGNDCINRNVLNGFKITVNFG